MAAEATVEQILARAREAYARNAYLAALADLQLVAEQRPRFADVQNLMGLCLSLVGRTDEALEAFERATSLNPGYVEAHLNRAITLNDLGRTEEAHASFSRAAEADVEKGGGRFSSVAAARLANKHSELGDLYADAGAGAEAIAEYRRAVRLRPQFLDIRNKLGRFLLDAGHLDEAIHELRSVVEAQPGFAAARANLGLALHRAGRLDEAEAEWRRTLAQAPDHAQVSSYLGMLERQRSGSRPGA
jgi:tetratricopeptide (TPR) repeat protein